MVSRPDRKAIPTEQREAAGIEMTRIECWPGLTMPDFPKTTAPRLTASRCLRPSVNQKGFVVCSGAALPTALTGIAFARFITCRIRNSVQPNGDSTADDHRKSGSTKRRRMGVAASTGFRYRWPQAMTNSSGALRPKRARFQYPVSLSIPMPSWFRASHPP